METLVTTLRLVESIPHLGEAFALATKLAELAKVTVDALDVYPLCVDLIPFRRSKRVAKMFARWWSTHQRSLALYITR